MPRGLRRGGLQGLQSSEDDVHFDAGNDDAGNDRHDAGDDLNVEVVHGLLGSLAV